MKDVAVIDNVNNANILAQVVGELFGHWPYILNTVEEARGYSKQKFDVVIMGEMDGKYKEIYPMMKADDKSVYTSNENVIQECKKIGIRAIKNTGNFGRDLGGILQ